jgi:hypothetical protein
MPKLIIPREYRAGLSQVKKLSPDDVAGIRAALDKTPIGLGPETSATDVLKSYTVAGGDAKQIGNAIGSLYGLRSRTESSLEEFINDIANAMEGVSEPELRLLPTERQRFTENLSALLGATVFSLNAKVFDLATDDERTFCSARILTDLRPVFGPRIEDGPQGMIVVHLLKLGYHQGAERHKQFFVSLDGNDVRELKKILERAESKTAALKNSVKDTRLFGLAKE